MTAVILVLASTGVSGLLNATADILTIVILPIKIIYKVIQGFHYWVVYLIRKVIIILKGSYNIGLKVFSCLITIIIVGVYSPFFIIYLVLGIIIFFVEIIRSLFRGLARLFDALPIYRSIIWFMNQAPGIPYVVRLENNYLLVRVKKQKVAYVAEDYIESLKEWWQKNSPRKVILKFLFVKHPELKRPEHVAEFEELTIREKFIVLKAALGIGELTDDVIRKLEQ